MNFNLEDINTIHIDNVVEYCRKHYKSGTGTGCNIWGIPMVPPFRISQLKHKDITILVACFDKNEIEEIEKCDAEFRLNCDVFLGTNRIGTFHIDLDKLGHLIKVNTYLSSEVELDGKRLDELANEWNPTLQNNMLYVFMTFAFMNCKNVIKTEVDPKKGLTRQVRRQMERKKESPLDKYYTLNIEPMKKVLSTEGSIEHNGLHKAMHICRGHFVTYDEKPMFGRIKGTFWKPQHVRGSKQNGEIHKDYNVIV